MGAGAGFDGCVEARLRFCIEACAEAQALTAAPLFLTLRRMRTRLALVTKFLDWAIGPGHAAGRSRSRLLALALCLSIAAVPAAGADAPPSDKPESHVGAELVLRTLSLLGVNYRFGGNSPETGLDCSGLVRHVFREAVGLVLPRRAEEISNRGERIEPTQLKPGDLVFFNTLRRAFSHVGVYIGNNQFVHAPSSGGSVRIERMDQAYWSRRFDGARRIELAQAGFPETSAALARKAQAAGAPPMNATPAPPPTLPLTGVALPRADQPFGESGTPLYNH